MTSSIAVHSTRNQNKTVSPRLLGTIRGVRTLAVNVLWGFGLTQDQIKRSLKLSGAQFEVYASHMYVLYKLYNQETALDYLKKLNADENRLEEKVKTTTYFYFNNHTLLPEDKPRISSAPKDMVVNDFFLANPKTEVPKAYVVSGKMKVDNHLIEASVATDVSALDPADYYQSNDLLEVDIRYLKKDHGIDVKRVVSYKIGPNGDKTRLHVLKSSIRLSKVFEM